jgi:hypothetical protein
MVRLAGAALLVAGLALGIDGLTLTGAIWLGFGLLVRFLTRDMRVAEEEAKARGEKPQPPSGRRLVWSTLVWLALGVPAIVIGLAEVGFDEGDQEWRWLPVALGSLVMAIGLIGSLLYGLGKGIGAIVDEIGNPTHPARLTIRAVRETGVYINNKPRMEFDFLVEPEGHPAYEVTKKATVPFASFGDLREGEGFEALVDLENPEAIEIRWHEPIGPPAQAPAAPRDTAARLEVLDGLLRDGKITEAEHAEQRTRILGSI